ncbi:SAM-dependent methyltransferase [Saccharopolyspora shandongensis]|uniref:SAM-dependent methyltransferase n=1 Tax=Saccharopolyspora shandongensis TaxID=418495 RepID=UPI0033C9E322
MGVDRFVPSVARMYDWCLGGKDNFDVDREAMQAMMNQGFPDVVAIARQNRVFLERGVHYLAAEAGIRQFIDHGSGLPTQRNVHEVAQEAQPDARVVYIDNDPAVLAHGRALLAQNQQTTVISADMSRPEDILADPAIQTLIDFDQPVALLYVSVLHCLPDDQRPDLVLRRLLDAVPSGSYVLISHLAGSDPQARDFLTNFMNERTPWGRVRSEDEIARFFDGLELVEPGLTNINDWRPEHRATQFPEPRGYTPSSATENSGRIWEYGGIARKP